MKQSRTSKGSMMLSVSSSSVGHGHRVGSTTSTTVRKAIWLGRFILLFFLIVTAVGFGVVAHFALTNSELALAESHFQSISDRLLGEASALAERKRLGTLSLSSVVAQLVPDATTWPFIQLAGYEVIANHIIAASSGQFMAVAPIVKEDQLEDFETFIYDYYENKRNPPFPNGSATSSFGKGIWGYDPFLNTTDHRYRITNGSTTYGSKYKIITPMIAHNQGYNPVLLFNSHSEKTRGLAIDSMIECSKERAASSDPASIICGKITDILELVGSTISPGPGAVMMQPIYPANDNTTMSGVLLSSIIWEELLQNGAPKSVTGIDCVLRTETQVYTYRINYGVAKLRGEGDLHEPRFNSSMRTTTLTGRTKYDETSAVYTLTIYPTAALYDSFKTENPKIAAAGSVIIILFTSVLFMLYDFVVRKEFNTKDKLLESKRRFVRFVSHEVRTPLNSVSMGLSLLQDECASALGYKSSEDLFAKEGHSGEQNLNAEANSGNVAFQKGTDVWRSRVFEWLYLVHDIQNNVQSSVDVLNDLLNYDKVESGTLSLELTSISIWDLIEQISNEFLLPLAKKKIAFELCFTDISVQDCKQSESAIGSKVAMLPPELRKQRVIGDVVRLAQVLRNLISNAVKFTNEGGEISVKVSWISPKTSNGEGKKDFVLNSGRQISGSTCGWLQVKVKDSGAGMTNDQLSKLFRHGVQFNVNELQAGQGSGLGLYIAKGIIEQHNGHLYADSQGLGTGSTFTLELPLFVIDVDQDYQREEEGEAQNDSGNEKLSSTIDHVNKLRILVVDDSETNRKLLCRILTNKGHDVDSAEDGSVAVDKVKESLSNGTNYDTILLDYEMPILNGPDTAIAIRSMGCDVFIVGVTGNMLAEDVSYFRSCGANALLGKPFKMKSLEDLWNEHHVCSDTPMEERV